jgi:DNA polymerase-3 subunit gamma/tau
MSGLFQEDPPQDEALPPQDGPGLFGDLAPAVADPGQPAAHAVAYRVLARKYRPTRFDDLIGQEAMVRTLRNAFATGRVAHAFMLTGVRGVGKTTTARIIARALNCTGPDGTGGPTADPCAVCGNCLAILAEREPDVFEMDAASRTGVDDVREIIEVSRSRPMKIRTKVFIIDEIHMLSRNAFNALLKTLEEPPPHVKFVFATTEIRKVPITVLSRCQRFDLRRVRVMELARHFARIAGQEAVTIEPAALDLIARAADGSVRDGLSLLDQAIAQAEGTITEAQCADMLGLADREAVFDLMEAVMAGKPAAALAITDRAYERGADLGTLLQDLLELLHTVTRLKSVPALHDSHDLPETERTRGAALAEQLTVPILARAWQMLLKGVAEVETAPDRRAAAEMVLIRLCHVAELPSPGDLVRRLTGGASQAAGPAPTSGGAAGAAAGGNRPAAGAIGGPAGGGPTGGSMRAMAGGGAIVAAEPAGSPAAAPQLASFRDVVALVAERREAMLHAHLVHSVHLVRFAPPVIELRPQSDAPRDLASKLAALLTDATGTRWTIAVSAGEGGATLAEQGSAADAARRSAAADHPLVRAIMEAFPGARIDQVHDTTTDAYGLPPELPVTGIAPAATEFPDTDYSDEMEIEE